MKQSVSTSKPAAPAQARESAKELAQRSGMTLAEWLEAAGGAERSRDTLSPLEALADRLDRLNRTSAASVRDNGPGALELSNALLERMRQAEERTASIFETLMRRNEDTEARTVAVIETIAKVTRDTENKTANALSAVAQWIEAAEKTPKIAVTEAMERRTAAMIEAVSQRLDQIETKLPRLDEALAKPFRIAIERLESRLDALAGESRALKDLPAIFSRTAADLDRKLADVAQRLDTVQEGQAEAALDQRHSEHVARIEEKLAGILNNLAARAIPEVAEDHSFDVVAQIAARQRDLDRAFEQASPDRAAEDRVAALTAKIDNMEASRRAMAAALEAKLDRLDGPRMGEADPSITELRRGIAEIARAVAEASPVRAIESLESQIVALAEKIDASRDRGVSEAVLAPLEGLLSDLARKVQEGRPTVLDPILSSGGEGIARIEARLEALGAKMETLAWPAPTGELDSVSAAVADIRDRIERVDQALDAPRVVGSTASLEAMIQRLASQLDAAQRPNAGDGAFVALEQQMARIAERLDAGPSAGGSEISGIERQLKDLFNQLEQTRNAAVEAARTAAEEVLNRASKAGVAEDTVRRELVDLRTAQDSADRRTQFALESVHKTLEKVVDRLAHLETDGAARPAAPRMDPILEAAQASRPPSPAQARPAEQAAPAAPAPARAPETPRIPEALKTLETLKPQEAPRPAEMPRVSARQPLMPDLPDDFPLEPGVNGGARPTSEPVLTAASEAPRAPTSPAAPATPQGSPVDPRASFIAAARRAAQAAAAEAATSVKGKPVVTPKPTAVDKAASDKAAAEKAAAEKAARMAAAEAARAEREAKAKNPPDRKAVERPTLASDQPDDEEVGTAKPNGALGAIRDLYQRRKRPILIGLAALVLALGSLQVAKLALPQLRRVPPSVENIDPAAAPATKQVAAATQGGSADAPALQTVAAVTPAQRALPAAGDSGLAAPVDARNEPVAPKIAPKAVPMSPPSVPSLTAAALSAVSAAADVTGSIDPAKTSALPESLEAAVNAGQPRAQFDLATRLADAKGADRNLEGAAILYRKAADAGFVPAQYRLGSMYEKGLGVARDAKTAQMWYERAANGGNVKAMHNMAVLYAEGAIGGKPDYANAAIWFEAAAEHGLRDSQYNIAILAARGLGIASSLDDAYRWLALAAAQGDQDAAKKRDEIGAKLGPDAVERLKAAVQDFEPKNAPVLANEETLPVVRWDKT